MCEDSFWKVFCTRSIHHTKSVPSPYQVPFNSHCRYVPFEGRRAKKGGWQGDGRGVYGYVIVAGYSFARSVT